jgi:hypothetical protein
VASEQSENVRGQPVVRVNDVKFSHTSLRGEEMPLEQMAHVRRLAKEVMVEIEAAAVHENSVHPLDFGSIRRQPRKRDERHGQAQPERGLVRKHEHPLRPTKNGVERVPGKKRNAHKPQSP